MKVFIATSAHRWNDIRIFKKEAISLANRFKVEIHAPAPFEKREVNGIQVFGLPQWIKVSERKMIRHELSRRIRKSDAGIFHFHDPELIPLALKVKLFYRKKVIYDIHEDYPLYFHHKSWIPKLFRRPVAFAFRHLEQLACRFFDHLITTSPAIDIRFSRYPSTIVANYPRLQLNGQFPRKPKDHIELIYAGSMEDIRGTRELGHAFIEASKRSSVKMKLNIAGPVRGSEQFCGDMGTIFTHPLVEYHGDLEYEKAVELMSSCHIGIIPFLPVPSNQNIIPHKLFDYMAAGLAILASDYPGWPTELENGEIGMLFNPLNQEKAIESLLVCAAQPARLEKMGRRAYELVHQRFSWDSQEENLFEVYKKVI